MRYLARISYDGSKFLGFQRLKNGKGVQNELERVLKILAKKEILVHGAGRTDAGVHALDQCIHFDLDISISVDKLKYVMNRLLKDSVVVNSIQVVSNDFHARYDVKEKTYEYFLLLKEKNAFLSNYAYIFYQDLDIEKMKEASHVFLGTHDFSNFVSGERENSVSTINDIQFSFPFTGDEESAARDSLCGLDRYRRSGRCDCGDPVVQRACDSGEDLLCVAAAGRDCGAESDIRTLRLRAF